MLNEKGENNEKPSNDSSLLFIVHFTILYHQCLQLLTIAMRVEGAGIPDELDGGLQRGITLVGRVAKYHAVRGYTGSEAEVLEVEGV